MGVVVKTWRLSTHLVIGLQVMIVLGGLIAAATASPDDKSKQSKTEPKGPLIHSLQGPDLYRAYCASCHGVDATGNGPVAPALVSKVPDLTTISKRNGGIFPSERVEKIISGDEFVVAHGTREMPVWGPIFHQVEQDRDYGYVRLHNLTDHLQSLQKK